MKHIRIEKNSCSNEHCKYWEYVIHFPLLLRQEDIRAGVYDNHYRFTMHSDSIMSDDEIIKNVLNERYFYLGLRKFLTLGLCSA